MIALWMVYATLVATILAVAAALLDRAAGSVLRQRRWLWMLALTLSAGIPAWSAIARRTGLAGDTRSAIQAKPNAAAPLRPASLVPQHQLAELINRARPESLGRLDAPLAVLWAATAVLALAGYAIATWSLARRRRTWRQTEVDGQVVLLTPATGPAVIGALRPAIVVPEWSLGLTAEQRSLMLDHERQHVAARDPLLLHVAAVIALLMPWNAAAWWLYRRLRLAVELDCDARVLATGRDPGSYGNLLLDVCARRIGSGMVLAPALFERTSSLTRRILAMYPARPRFARMRLALGVTAAFAATVIACDMPSPEALAPDGTNQANKRLYGELSAKLEAESRYRAGTTKAMVSRYFPSVALGNTGPSILFLVKSTAGDVVLTETQPASEFARMPLRMAREKYRWQASSSSVNARSSTKGMHCSRHRQSFRWHFQGSERLVKRCSSRFRPRRDGYRRGSGR